MRLLLDTHVFLWCLVDSPRLSAAVKQQILEADEVFVSAASIWEASIKASIGKLHLGSENLAGEIAANGFVELPVRAIHAVQVMKLPRYHSDPFDRLLLAQAMHEPLHLLTADARLAQYTPQVVVI